MTRARSTVLAWSLLSLCVAELLFVLVLTALSWGIETPQSKDGFVGVGLLFIIPILAFPTIGAVVASRRPRHPVGWLFLGVGLLFGVSALAPEYADFTLYAKPGSLPAVGVFVWSSTWVDTTLFLSIAFLLLLFPTGKLPSRRWRPALWLAVAAVVLSFMTSAFKPGPVWKDTLNVDNPLGIGALGSLLDTAGTVVWFSFAGTMLLAGASVIVRFRHAHGDERQQLKWISFAALVLVVAFAAGNTTGHLGATGDAVVNGILALALAGIPVAAGLSILRYRLYEIDRVISRTLVYVVLTAILGAAYVGLVLAGQALFSSFAGGSNLAIAVSTLVVAALFLPVRFRVQRFVDRRFYRRRYDAQRTLEAFGARLREQVDLETLQAELRGVVHETMQPVSVGLWVRPGAQG